MDFKYLLQELSGDLLKLLGVNLCEYMDSLKQFSGKKLSDRYNVFSS